MLLAACPGGPGKNDGGKGGGAGGGTGGGTATDAFTIYTLDPDAKEATYLAMAYDAVKERVGVVYYTPKGTETLAGHPDYLLKYVEWNKGVTGPVETVGTQVQRRVGLALQFNPTSGEPVSALLGGGQGFVPGLSIYWFQSDAALRTRAGGTWTESIAAVDGNETVCGNPVSDRGFLVGLWPALAYDSTGKLFFAWRDCHDGQFPQQDWNGSDVEVAAGGPGAWTKTCVQAGGNSKQAYGGRIQMVMGANDLPVMVYDQVFGTSDGTGANVVFQMRKADGSWSNPNIVLSLTNTQNGASIAYDTTEGYGIAVLDGSSGRLLYVNSLTGTSFTAPDEASGAGASGWYPSLAMDPINHEPAIASYYCSARSGSTSDQCQVDEDELRITQRVSGNWRDQTVDTAGAYSPKLGFFASGKRFVAYRDPRTGVVKLAVEK